MRRRRRRRGCHVQRRVAHHSVVDGEPGSGEPVGGGHHADRVTDDGDDESITEKSRGTFGSRIVTRSRYEFPATAATVTPVVNPFFAAMSSASVVAGEIARHPGQAIAAASAARWILDARAYRPPRSTANDDAVRSKVIVKAVIHNT